MKLILCHTALLFHVTALGHNIVDSTAEKESLLRILVALASENSLEAVECILYPYILSLKTCEMLSNMERL